jgi:hypothetical protein
MVVVLRRSDVSPPASMTVASGGVVSWKPDEGCVLCCVRMGEGTIWRRGGVDGKPGDRLHFGLTPWRWFHGEREVEVTSRA